MNECTIINIVMPLAFCAFVAFIIFGVFAPTDNTNFYKALSDLNNVNTCTGLIQALTFACYIPSVIQVIRLLRKRKNEKHLTLKLIGNALFYEPFIAYELIQKFRHRQTIQVKT